MTYEVSYRFGSVDINFISSLRVYNLLYIVHYCILNGNHMGSMRVPYGNIGPMWDPCGHASLRVYNLFYCILLALLLLHLILFRTTKL